jgi:hypothetical protein
MEFTDIQLEALFTAKMLAREGKAFVPVEDAADDCEELADADWLAREQQENADTAYSWTQQAETALDLNQLTSSVDGRQN